MRPLVPLCTAAALAIAGWLAFGTVTVRSLAAPARIGVLPPVTLLLLLFVVLLAAAMPLVARRWSRCGAVVVLLTPILVPWVPWPVPDAALVWTGPLGLAWWLACVAYAFADAFGWLAARTAWSWRDRRRAPVTAALITGVALTATAWHTASQHPRGDEPDYLIVTQSLLLDGDLQIENNHARADYAAYHREPLPPAYLQRGRNGAIYSVHAPGLSLLLLPGFALGGAPGAVATLILVAMVGAWLAWRAAWRVTRDVTASWMGTLGTVGAAPFFLHGSAIFPDAPAAVLALVGVDAFLSLPSGAPARRWALVGAALALLPWLHTRYALIAAGLGLALVVRLGREGRWRQVAGFALPASLAASAWFGFFIIVYGTPSPSAPYGAYAQMAIAHLAPGVPGLLVDQQFGVLAAAPVLALAAMAVRRDAGTYLPRTWLRCVVVVAVALAYLLTVAAYRMWWGGLSAPARFLVPLVLPLAPLVALGWQSVWTRAGRQLAVGLLLVSLALTGALVTVQHGALAYNVRDGAARLAVWAGPLIDLAAALPSAHRDVPIVVVRDAGVWIGLLAGCWVGWRWLERRRWLSPFVGLATVALALPAGAATVWSMHDVRGLAPAASQVRFLERRSASGAVLWTITPPPIGRTRLWFEVELDSKRNRRASDYGLLRPGRLPAGRYRLHTDIAEPGARLGVTLGEGRVSRFLAELSASGAHPTVDFSVPLPVEGLVVKGSAEAAAARGRVWITPLGIAPDSRDLTAATRLHPVGERTWILPERGIHAEPDGIWVGGDTEAVVGVDGPPRLALRLQAGAAAVRVMFEGSGMTTVGLAAGESRDLEVGTRAGRLRVRVDGGFRPSAVSPDNGDRRWLGVRIAAR